MDKDKVDRPLFITSDRFLSEVEKETLMAGRLITLTPRQLQDMAQKANRRMMGFQISCQVEMTSALAQVVKHYRVDLNLSWRETAQACYYDVNFRQWRDSWWPPNNQIMGMALCERAAELRGENYLLPPWN